MDGGRGGGGGGGGGSVGRFATMQLYPGLDGAGIHYSDAGWGNGTEGMGEGKYRIRKRREKEGR